MSESADVVTGGKREQVRESARKVGEGIGEMGDVAKKAALEAAEMSKEKASALVGEIEQFVRDKPVQSVLIAAGVGVVVGLLLRR